MAIRGDLAVVNLGAIMELLCANGEAAGLVLERTGQEGAMYFEGGRLVHARLGGRGGPLALRDLLEWHEGTFSIERGAQPPARSLALRWDEALREATRRRGVARRSADSAKPPSAETHRTTATDRELEEQLLHLFSRLEQIWARRGDSRRGQAEAAGVIGALHEITDAVREALAEGPLADARAFEQIMERAAIGHPALRLFVRSDGSLPNGGLRDTFVNFPGGSEARHAAFADICLGLVLAIEASLATSTDEFSSEQYATPWREIGEGFVREIRDVASRTRF